MLEEIKNLISQAKSICIIPSQHEPESLTAALALFYTLRELNKNVNLIIEEVPEKLQFLIPSLDFISSPKNFVISIPRALADVSQVYYEKNEDHLKIHLTLDKGIIKKDNISFYFSEAKPDLVITLAIQDFQKELAGQLDSFGFMLDAPILNIDNNESNKKFGSVAIVENKSIAEITSAIIASLQESPIKKEQANCLLAGMVAYYENFKSATTTPQILKLCATLMEQGANYRQITDAFYTTTQAQMQFLTEIFKHLKNENGSYVSELQSDTFWNFGKQEADAAMEKISGLGMQNNLLVLWKSHASLPMIKGFFHSRNKDTIKKVAERGNHTVKNNWVFLTAPGEDMAAAKNEILKNL